MFHLWKRPFLLFQPYNLTKITFNWFVNKPLGKHIAFQNFWKVFNIVMKTLSSQCYLFFVGSIYMRVLINLNLCF